MRLPLFALCLLASWMLGAVPAQAAALPKLGLLPFTAKRISPDTVAILDDLLVNAVDRSKRYDIITASDINALLGVEKMQDMLNCTSTSCIAELGAALGAEWLLSGSVSILGDELIVSLTLIDIKKQHVEAREQVRVANREGLYAEAIERVVQALLNAETPAGEAAAAPLPPPPSAAPTVSMAEVYFTHDSDEPLGVFVRLPGGDERHCPSGVTRSNPCTLEVPAGRVMVLSKGGATRKTLRLRPGRTEYKLDVGSSRTGMITGGSIAGAGAIALIVGGVTLHACSGDGCVNGGAIAAMATGGAAVYGGLITLLFASIIDFDQSVIVGPNRAPVETGIPLWVPSISAGGFYNSLLWHF